MRERIFLSTLFLLLAGSLFCQEIGRDNFRSNCAVTQSRTFLEINNVRANLSSGGDLWWTTGQQQYEVPKDGYVFTNLSGGVWLGGVDPIGNLKMAAQAFKTNTRNDFWAGPLDNQGETTPQDCLNWDRFFHVKADEILEHIAKTKARNNGEIAYPVSEIPLNILSWPALGNPYFEAAAGFALPLESAPLASFHDADNDGLYNPFHGDYPILSSNMAGGGVNGEMIPDEQIFSIYHDAGIHTRSNGFPLFVQINQTAFAFKTQDEVNDMTFYQFKAHNRSTNDLDSVYFGLFVAPSLGCFGLDHIGSDPDRNMFFAYNDYETLVANDCACFGVPFNCEPTHMLGFRLYHSSGDNSLHSFTYFNNAGIGNHDASTTDPNTAIQFYRYLTGSWRDGTPFTFGGSGYNPGSSNITSFAFPSPPNESHPNAWSMCTEDLSISDRRMIGTTKWGKFEVGAQKEALFGIPLVHGNRRRCPDLAALRVASDLGELHLLHKLLEEGLLPGPDAPDIEVIESSQEIVILLSNAESSNNYLESYREREPKFRNKEEGDNIDFLFEGYIVYQLVNEHVGIDELNDPNKARIIAQSDLANQVMDIYNWSRVEDPFGIHTIFVPELKVAGSNQGIKNALRITKDAFASNSDDHLMNNKRYYYTAIAYAHNNYANFNPTNGIGQRKPFLPSSRNIKTITAIPRAQEVSDPSTPLGTYLPITRLNGKGNPGVFLEWEDSFYNLIDSSSFSGRIVYKTGAGPILAKVVDPEQIKDVTLELLFFNEDGSSGVSQNTLWKLRNLDTGEEIVSDFTLERFNEQIIRAYGISIEMFQPNLPGSNLGATRSDPLNGIVNTRFLLRNNQDAAWLSGQPSDPELFEIPNDGAPFAPLQYVLNQRQQPDFNLDPTQAFTNTDEPSFVPLFAVSHHVLTPTPYYSIGPMLKNNVAGDMLRRASGPENLNNVDIVLTSDKSKWSRSIVLQSSNVFYAEAGFLTSDITNMFDYREHPSIGKDGRYATVDGTKQGLALTSTSNNPNDPNYLSPKGMGWFPGYALDIETGERLNILFAENSSYDAQYIDFYQDGKTIGDDMIWNPSDQLLIDEFEGSIMKYFMGGQHYIYVTRDKYDGCANLISHFTPRRNAVTKRLGFEQITWAGFPVLRHGKKLLSYEEGLIPEETIIQLRANQHYNAMIDGSNNGMPHYLIFSKSDLVSSSVEAPRPTFRSKLAPNPFITSQHTFINLIDIPPRCEIYLIDMQGRVLRKELIDSVGTEQISSYLLTLPHHLMQTGTYLINIRTKREGVQTLKLIYY